MSKTKRKQKKKIISRKVFFTIVIFLMLLLIISLLFFFSSLGFINNPFSGISAKSEKFTLNDECSIIVGQLIHTVQDEGACQNKCYSQCQSIDADFVRIEFTERPNNCNLCDCYCK